MSSPMRLIFPLAVLLGLLATAAGADDLAPDNEYQPGRGWQIPGTGFKLGGYSSFSVEDERRQPAKAGIDDFSLFIHWEGDGKLRLFSEIDFEDPVVWESGRGATTQHAYIALERLYADYLYSEKLNFRAGKFLTPVGRWNTIHAAPLVWTTSRPLVTESTFPDNATGAMVFGTLPVLGKDIDYSLYSAIGNEWRADPKLDPFSEAYGLHLNVPTSTAGEFGLSYANFEQKGAEGERRNLLGLDYFWTHDRYEVSAEAVYRFSDEGSQADERGLFVQAVAPVSEHWYAIGRYELYDKAGPAPAMNLWLAGVAMRLSPAMILKAEYSHAFHNRIQASEGLFASFAILF